jgi:putative MATE family efflux protein
MLITSIYNMADTYFVGSLGPSAQAATGVLFTLQAIIQGIAFMLGQGSGTFISRELADRNVESASKYISSAFFIGGTTGICILTLGMLFLEPMILFLGSTETILPHAKDYGLWVLISCPLVITSMILNNGLRFEGKAFYAMFGLTAGGLLNILGDYLLVIKCSMGVFGAGLATAVSQTISFLILLFMYRKMAQSKIHIKYASKHIRDYLAICKAGFPSLIRQSLTSLTTGVLNNLTKPFGDAAIAAMSVVSRYSMFMMCVGLGMGQGFQPVAAFNYRAKKYDRVVRITYMCYFTSLFVSAAITAIIYLLRNPLFALYGVTVGTDALSAMAYNAATKRLQFHLLPFVTFSFMDTGSGIARGLKKAISSTVLTLIGTCVFRVVWIFTIFRLGTSCGKVSSAKFAPFEFQLILYIQLHLCGHQCR